MRRIFLTVLAFFFFTFNVSNANFFKSEEIDVPFDKNIEQSQDQEEFYQLDEEELKQMGYELTPEQNDTELEEVQVLKSVNLETVDSDLIPPASEKTFILGVEKTDEYRPVRAQNMLWDTSKNFLNVYYQDSKNQSPMPVVMNASNVSNYLDSSTKAYVGQSILGSLNGSSVDFIKVNETTYNNGAKIENKNRLFNLVAGVYDSTLKHNVSGGMALATNPIKLPHLMGSFVFGGGYFANELDSDTKKTGGLFGEYRINRLKLNLQTGKSKYANSDNLETSLYFTPEFQLTDSLSVKTRLVKNISQDTNQDEIGLSYKPKKNNPRDFEFEINAANTYAESQLNKQRVRFSAKFKL